VMSRGTWIVAASGRARSWSRVKMRVWSPTVTVIVGSSARANPGHRKRHNKTITRIAALPLELRREFATAYFTILSAEEMELCYTQSADVPNNQIVATCFSIKRTGK